MTGKGAGRMCSVILCKLILTAWTRLGLRHKWTYLGQAGTQVRSTAAEAPIDDNHVALNQSCALKRSYNLLLATENDVV